MSYQVLARKYRPAEFSQLVGQQHVVDALTNALTQQRLHHAYLFTGTRGVGKTTIARILAKSLNCLDGVSASPCGRCEHCTDIDAGRFVDLIEVDAASRTKIEDTREILDNVQYAPSRGQYKVYLIDEVHMLSRHSFNALLKTLEEPPPHVVFLLATTDPQKLPITVLSRCLQFNLRALTAAQISAHLHKVLSLEQITFSDNALAMLAKAASGSIRDSLSLTDQAIAQGNGVVNDETVRSMLGLLHDGWIYKIAAALIKGQRQVVFEHFDQLSSLAPDFERFLIELSELWHLIAMTQLVPAAAKVDEKRQGLVAKFARAISPEQLQVFYQVCIQGRKDLPHAPEPRTGVEMTLLRLLAFQPVVAIDTSQTTLVSNQAAPSSCEINFNDAELASLDTAENQIDSAVLSTSRVAETDNLANATVSAKAIIDSTADLETPADDNGQTSLASLSFEQSILMDQAENLGVAGYKKDTAEQSHTDKHNHAVEDNSSANQAVSPPSLSNELALEPDYPALTEAEITGQQPPLAMDDIATFDPMSQSDTMLIDEPQDMDGEGQVQHAPIEVKDEKDAKDAKESIVDDDTTENILLSRNMLRSRKLKLAEQAKKNSVISGEGKGLSRPSLLAAKQAKQSEALIEPASTQDNDEPSAEKNVEKTPNQTQVAELTPHPKPVGNPSTSDAPQSDVPELVSAQSTLSEREEVVVPVGHAPMTDFALVADLPTVDPKLNRVSAELNSWAKVVDEMQLGGRLRQLAIHSVLVKNEDQVTLYLSPDQKHLNTNAARAQIEASMQAYWQSPITLEVIEQQPQSATPFQIQQYINLKRQQFAQQIIADDPIVLQLQSMFSAKVESESIQPL